MLKNPLRWARDRKQPVWKRALKRVAVILLVISLAFGSLMVVSPTARATFIRWVTEWYETHVTYRYAGDDMVGDLVARVKSSCLKIWKQPEMLSLGLMLNKTFSLLFRLD